LESDEDEEEAEEDSEDEEARGEDPVVVPFMSSSVLEALSMVERRLL
jgi:hypothetical protein